MRRLIGSGPFALALLCLAVPWLSLSVGCTGDLAPQRGGALLFGGAAHIDATSTQTAATGATVQVRTVGTMDMSPQPFAWATVLLAVVGIGLARSRSRRSFRVRTLLGIAGALAMLAYSALLRANVTGFTFHGSGPPPPTDLGMGPVLAGSAFVYVAVMNSTLLLAFPGEFQNVLETQKWKAFRRIGLCSGGVALLGFLLSYGLFWATLSFVDAVR